ncbi:CoB--CoM heterodisulfide reductase iron-sulfur subunit B family protein [Desulfopila inferna]|uniref:CoB--CoM heterodisulfide reductase iron-sulfur subunit B family protein n=1 Tax=Desulfopila inferna TaxID=468528 RepID=UPI0019648752|nr:CoB--CoM heterodisulfide reductase iron-sulfur subunit B family protein [Desulfopila inferna]MBM9603123.1 CoB--CoM heterodisulfide reductase iron-sulfur subunit B family protein [Desulfopila inferna]
MKISYYPGCTLKYKAKNLETSALASLDALGIDVEEMDRWNCCGAVYSLANDDLIHMVGPARNLLRAKEQGADKIVTLCSMCYNTLARVNQLMKNDVEKRDTINRFMDDEIDYFGEVEVVHYLTLLKEEIGWEAIRDKVKNPLNDFKIASYYGCTLQRPEEVGIEPLGSFALMNELLAALGAEVVPFSAADKCCGSYQVICEEAGDNAAAAKVINAASASGAEALATSCPLCEFNLGKQQDALMGKGKISANVSTLYFTQLLAMALGIDAGECCLELNDKKAVELLETKNRLTAA